MSDELSPEARKGLGILLKWIGIFILGILIFSYLSPIVFVGAGERGVLLDFGKVTDTTMNPGLNFMMPIKNSVIKIDVQTQVYEAEATAASKDMQDAKTKVALNYHLEPTSVNGLYRDVGVDYRVKLIAPAIQEVVKSSTAKFNAEELITRRQAVKDEIQNGLSQRLITRGINVEQISITNFEFSQQFAQAIEQKVTAQQLALKAENDLKRIEIEARQKVAQAEGEKQATILIAEGRAKEVEIIQKQLTQSPQYINYMAVRSWNGVLPMVTGGSGIPLIQLPITPQIPS